MTPQEQVNAIESYLDRCAAGDFDNEVLNEWEQDFIESISSQLSKGYTLSSKQLAVLDRIHTAVIEELEE